MQCLICNKTLRKEPSLSRGIGPKCAKRVRGMAGMTGTGGKAFTVLSDTFWEKYIDELVAIRKRQSKAKNALKVIPIERADKKGRIILQEAGSYQVYGKKINDDEDLATMFKDMSNFDREKVYVACLDAEGMLIGTQVVSVGSIDAAIVSPREVLKVPFLLGASSFYLLHNHPSGDPTPSDEDRKVTARMAASGELMGIPLRGHAVIGTERYCMIDAKRPDQSDYGKYNEAAEPEQIPLFDTQQERNEAYREQFTNPDQVAFYAKSNVFRDDKKGTYIICL